MSFVDPTGLAADSCTTVDAWSKDGENWVLNTTLKCQSQGGGGSAGGSSWLEFLSWALSRAVDTFTGSETLNGADADRLPYTGYSPPGVAAAALDVALVGVAVVAGAKTGIAGTATTAAATTTTKAAATQALKAGLTIPNGNRKAGLEHILVRHSFNTGAENVSKFLRGDGFIEIKALINEAASGTAPWEIQGSLRVLNASMGRIIGYDQTGSPVSGLRVVANPNGSVITAYPVRR